MLSIFSTNKVHPSSLPLVTLILIISLNHGFPNLWQGRKLNWTNGSLLLFSVICYFFFFSFWASQGFISSCIFYKTLPSPVCDFCLVSSVFSDTFRIIFYLFMNVYDFVLFRDRFLLYSSGWLQIHNLPAPVIQTTETPGMPHYTSA